MFSFLTLEYLGDLSESSEFSSVSSMTLEEPVAIPRGVLWKGLGFEAGTGLCLREDVPGAVPRRRAPAGS